MEKKAPPATLREKVADLANDGVKTVKKRVAMLITSALFVIANNAHAEGCMKGALVGGVAGHYAGHHAVVGAIGGCMVGRHLAKEKRKQAEAQNAAQTQTLQAAAH